MRALRILALILLLTTVAGAASKTHVIAFGKPVAVKLYLDASAERTLDITVRPLYVDSRLREYTTGKPHDVTDREFVVRRAFRINDSLPDDAPATPRWLWRRGGWLLVDRDSGRVSQIRLPDFEPFYSEVSWYRDYAAYCGITGNGERVIAVVAQIGNKKALYRKELGQASATEAPDANCAAPRWDRKPPQVTFLPKHGEKFSVNVSGRFVDPVPDSAAEEQ